VVMQSRGFILGEETLDVLPTCRGRKSQLPGRVG
jgi:hypothetical protein